MVKFIIRYRWYIILFFIFTGIAFAGLIPLIQTDPEIRNYIPAGMDSKVATDSIEKAFGVQDIVMIIFTDKNILNRDNLERIRNIDRGISRTKGISRRMSPFTLKTIKGEDGAMVAERLISRIPEDSSGITELKNSILENQFVKGIVFSPDLTAASITAFIDPEYPESETLGRVDSVLAAFPGKAEVIMGGLPYIRRYIMEDVQRDAMILVPSALILMLLILKFSLRDWKSVIMPFSVVLVSTLVCIGLVPLSGWRLSLMTMLAPVILIAVANNYGIYLTARYQDISLAEPGIEKSTMLARLTESLSMPILFSGLTTIAGILGLLTHSVTAARQVGILAAAGIIIALIMSLFYIPALIYLRKPFQKGQKTAETGDFFSRLSVKLAVAITDHPGRILVISLFVVAVFAAGIFMIRIDTNQENYFPKHHPVREASKIINDNFGGSQTVSVMFEGDIKDPVIMKAIDDITIQMENEPGVGSVFSISQVVREMSKAIYNKNEEGYNALPRSREAIAQFFELYNLSGDTDDFSQILNFEKTRSQILIRLSDPENRIVRQVTGKLQELSSDVPALVTTGGYAMIMSDFAGLIIRGQLYSLLFAIISVFLLLTVIFRSVKGGFIGSVPLFASMLILFGFMGFSGIAIDAATALLSSVMIGVGVDFTIQYIWSFNTFVASGASYRDSVIKAHETIGRSIIINAFSVMAGFAVLMLSGFTSIRFFGYLVLISIGSCLLGAVIVIPAILVWFRPGFAAKRFNK